MRARPPREAAGASGAVTELAVDLARDVPFQAADDLFLRQSFFAAPVSVGAGSRAGSQPDDHDPPQRAVGLAVAAAVEPVPAGGLAGRGRDRGGTAQMRPRAFTAQPPGMMPAATSSSAAVSGPTPCKPSRPGARAVTSGPISSSSRFVWARGTGCGGPARAVRPGSRSRARRLAGAAAPRSPRPARPWNARRTGPAAPPGRS